MSLTLLNLAEAHAAERKRIAEAKRTPSRISRLATRMYAAARLSRLTEGWGQSESSADTELVSSLRTLRARSRALVRDAGYAKRAKRIIQNNVIGSGVGLQARVQTARLSLNERVNDDIEALWSEWTRAEHCHSGGTLHFADLERLMVGQVFEAGEIFLRKHFEPMPGSPVPLTLEVIEPERMADEFHPNAGAVSNTLRMAVEVDPFYRPVAYWIRRLHPGEFRLGQFRSDDIERVPADQIIHLRIVDRWPQTRGEPWLHAVARRLNDMDGYAEAEIVGARGGASYLGTIETSQEYGTETEDGGKEFVLEPGVVERLGPGEKFNLHTPNRPNSAIDPFMRLMLREVAAGADVSYESLSRDYSQSNYSSSRLALLDDRDLWRALQTWFIRTVRLPLHRIWIQQAVLARALTSIPLEAYALNRQKFEEVRFKPRGWSWIDPPKEVGAYKEAIKAGLETQSSVIARTGEGRDLWDVLTEREEELRLAREKGLKFDTDPSLLGKQPKATDSPEDEDEDDENQPTKPARNLAVIR